MRERSFVCTLVSVERQRVDSVLIALERDDFLSRSERSTLECMSSASFDVAAEPRANGQPEAVFQARGLTKVYSMGEVEVRAVRGVDLELYAGEFVVLLGPSGSGKSTLLNILGGLDVPSGGTVFYRGRELTEFDDTALTRYRREHVGFVFQFYNLIPSLT